MSETYEDQDPPSVVPGPDKAPSDPVEELEDEEADDDGEEPDTISDRERDYNERT